MVESSEISRFSAVIAPLQAAGIVPGILLAGLFILTIVIWVHFSPEMAPRGPRSDFRARLASLVGLIEKDGLGCGVFQIINELCRRQSKSSDPVGIIRIFGFFLTGTLNMPPVRSAPTQYGVIT